MSVKPTTPYQDGIFAREHGFGMVHDNPYPAGSEAWKEFCRGWMAMNRSMAGLKAQSPASGGTTA